MTAIETRSCITVLLILTGIVGVPEAASANSSAGEAAVAGAPARSATDAPSDSALPYSLPWQLRPVTIGNLARVDSVAAVFNDANGNLDVAVATAVTARYRLTRNWAPMVRLAFVGNNAPGEATDGTSLANPLVGATYARTLGSHRMALFGATTLPIGTGGGDAPSLRVAKTNMASSTARPADDAMFAVSYMTAVAGADFAYVSNGLTAQAEATLLQSVRVRGDNGGDATPLFRTEAAAGLHLGYFIGSHFSLSSDLHHRRGLFHAHRTSLSATTIAVGPRFHFRVGRQGWIRPGVSFVRGFDARGFDAPLLTAQTTGVQLDVPVMF